MFKQADDGYWYVINNPVPAGSPAAEFWAQPFVLDKIDDDDKFPYGKPQTDEVARGSGTESMAVRD